MNDKKKVFPICLTTLVLAQFISVIVNYSQLLRISTFIQSSSEIKASRSLLVLAVLYASGDTVLALLIVALLYRLRSKALFSRTSSMIDRIMMYTVGSGLLTAAFALAGLITSIVATHNLVFVLIMEMLPKRELISRGSSVYRF